MFLFLVSMRPLVIFVLSRGCSVFSSLSGHVVYFVLSVGGPGEQCFLLFYFRKELKRKEKEKRMMKERRVENNAH